MSVFKRGTAELDPPNTKDPKWLELARSELGVKEVSGSKSNPRIDEYASETSLHATSDETPWCASFVSWCLEKSGIKSTRNAWAQSYTNWGEHLDIPINGCVVVFRWSAEAGHVGFYEASHKGSMKLPILGGNQSNQVCVKDFGDSIGSVVGYRWPKGVLR